MGAPLAHVRAPATIRPRGDAAAHRRAPRHRHDGRAGHAPADLRTTGGDHPAVRRVVAAGGAVQRVGPPGSLALEWMDRFGDNLYNLFASTEVAAATIARPGPARSAPGTRACRRRGSAYWPGRRAGPAHRRPGARGASSWGRASPSRATRAARPRTRSTASCRSATWATSTTTGTCSWAAGTTR